MLGGEFKQIPFNMPEEFTEAARRFAESCVRFGYGDYAAVSVFNGTVNSISFEIDGATRTFFPDGKGWHETVEVGR